MDSYGLPSRFPRFESQPPPDAYRESQGAHPRCLHDSKFQVTLPRSLARAHAIKPGSHITFDSAGTMIQVRMEPGKAGDSSPEERARSFDLATARQQDRDAGMLQRVGKIDATRGWARAMLYEGRG